MTARPRIPSQVPRVTASWLAGEGRECSGPLRHHRSETELLRLEADGAWKALAHVVAENRRLRMGQAA